MLDPSSVAEWFSEKPQNPIVQTFGGSNNSRFAAVPHALSRISVHPFQMDHWIQLAILDLRPFLIRGSELTSPLYS